MTEAEAKTKWCPFARALGTLTKVGGSTEEVVTAHGPQNRGYALGGALHNCLCIGSACMAWRWNEQDYDYAVTKAEPVPGTNAVRIPQPDAQEGWERIPTGAIDFARVPWRRRVPNQHGHCGLAGKP